MHHSHTGLLHATNELVFYSRANVSVCINLLFMPCLLLVNPLFLCLLVQVAQFTYFCRDQLWFQKKTVLQVRKTFKRGGSMLIKISTLSTVLRVWKLASRCFQFSPTGNLACVVFFCKSVWQRGLHISFLRASLSGRGFVRLPSWCAVWYTSTGFYAHMYRYLRACVESHV